MTTATDNNFTTAPEQTESNQYREYFADWPGGTLPCIDVQDEAICFAANAVHPEAEDNVSGWNHVADVTHMGQDNPNMERFWQANGSLAVVTYFDKGNGWSSVHQLMSKTEEDAREFSKRLWGEVLELADNREQNIEMLQQAVGGCHREGGCACADKLAAINPQA